MILVQRFYLRDKFAIWICNDPYGCDDDDDSRWVREDKE